MPCTSGKLPGTDRPANGGSKMRAFWMQHLSALAPLFGSESAAQAWLRMVMFRDEIPEAPAVQGSSFTRIRTEVYTASGPWHQASWYDVSFPRVQQIVPDYSHAPSRTDGGLMGLGKVLGSFPPTVGEINATVVYKL